MIVRYLTALLIFTLFAGCSDDDSNSIDNDQTSSSTSQTVTITDTNTTGTPEGDTENTGADEDDLVENATFESTIQIAFSATTTAITNPLAGNGVVVTAVGGQVTVESTVSKVAYQVSGTIADGCLKIYSEKKFILILDNVDITNNSGPAINIQSGKTAFVILEGINSLTDASTYSDIPSDEDAKGTFFSEGQLVFSGTGSLSVAGKYKHGIVSDDYIRIIEGNITVSEAKKDALHANDYIIVDNGVLDLSADSDGIDCEEGYIILNEGDFTLDVADDGIVASYDITEETEPDESITPYVTINGGIFNITTSEGEGIESKSILTINEGLFEIYAYDDGLNAIEAMYINGGKLYVKSTNNDAIDSNGPITITGGITIAIGTAEPESGFDADNNTFKIAGGTVLGLGGTTTRPTASVSTQNSVIMDGVSANKLLHIQSNDGVEALTFLVPKTVNTILYSGVKLTSGTTFSIFTGGAVTDGEDFNGLYSSGSYSGGVAQNTSFTINSRVTDIGGKIGPN